jgi:DNA-binding transcriptional ArsR family regulator
VPVFAALGDATRLAIVAELCRSGPQRTVQLGKVARVSRQAITKHLRTLEGAGLVLSGRAGRDRLWRMETNRLADTRTYLDRISAQWDATLERLRRFVEDECE